MFGEPDGMLTSDLTSAILCNTVYKSFIKLEFPPAATGEIDIVFN